MTICPNTNLPEYQSLIATYGEGRALAAWQLNGQNIPTVEQVAGLLQGPDIMFQLSPDDVVQRLLTGFKNLTPKFFHNKFVGYDTKGSAISMADKINKWISSKQDFSGIRAIASGTYNTVLFQDKNTGQFFQLNNNIKHELQSIILEGKGSDQKDDIIQTTLDYFRAEERADKEGRSYVQTQSLSQFIKSQGFVYNKKLPEKELGHGNEQTVYDDRDNNIVIKVNKGNHYKNWKEYLENLLLHNNLFEDTRYTLLGFLVDGQQIQAVVSQPWVDPEMSEPVSTAEIREYLAQAGYEPFGDRERREFNYYNKELGVLIKDLHDKNVIKRGGELFFIDTNIYTDGTFYEQSPTLQQQFSSISGPVDQVLNIKLKSFAENKLGGKVDLVQRIVVDGKIIPANAVTDVVSRTIQLADDKVQIDTLPEEVAHIYTHWLPKNSILLRDMVADIKTRPIYQQVMDQYSDNTYYQHPDGTVDENKIAMEAIGKHIAGVIVGQYTDSKSKSLLKRLIDWITGLFKGKDFDAYQVIASDILAGDVSKLDMKAVKEANIRGEMYFQLSEQADKFIKSQMSGATQAQKDAIDKLLYNPENRVVLNEKQHVYTDLKQNVYRSTTAIINGEFTGDTDEYEINRQWGNDFDRILQGVITGELPSKIQTPTLSDEMKESIYRDMAVFVGQMTADGSIALTQVVVSTPYDADPTKRTAGSIDLLLVHKDGTLSVIDLKTSWHSKSSTQYNTPYEVGPGSVLVNQDNSPMMLNRRSKHSVQVRSYSKMLRLAGFDVTDAWSKHLHIVAVNGALTGYEDEGIVQHLDSTNRTLVDKVVPGVWQGKQAIPDPNPLHAEPVMDDEQLEQYQKELEQRVTSLYTATVSFRDRLAKIKKDVQFSPSGETLQNMDELLSAIHDEIDNKKDYSEAYSIFLNAAREQLTKLLNYIGHTEDGKLVNASDPRFLRVVAMAAQYLESFQGLYHTEEFATVSQQKVYKQVDKLLRSVGQAIINAQTYTADRNIYDRSVNIAIKNLIDKSIINSEGTYISGLDTLRDIDSIQAMAGSLGGNTYLDITQKQITDAAETAREYIESRLIDIDAVANKLVQTGTKDYDFMKVRENGKWTGKIVTSIGKIYREMRMAVDRPLRDPITGEPKQYIPIHDITTASKEDVDYNKELWKLKRARTLFMNAEDIVLTEDGDTVVEDGKYHRYNDAFKAERALYMRVQMNKYGVGKWVFKSAKSLPQATKDQLAARYPGKSLEDAWSRECTIWRDRNYSYSPYTTVVIDKQGKPTGVTRRVEGDAAFFPKQEHVRIREIASDGTHLTDEQYRKLMNPTNAQEQAQTDYYKMYMKMMGEEVEKLPSDAIFWFEQGNVPSIQGNIFQLLQDKGADVSTAIRAALKPDFSPKSFIGGKDTIATKSIPVAFMNPIHDVNRLQGLQKELQMLTTKKDSIKPEEYTEQYNTIKELIDAENKKLKAEKLHPDLTEGLKAFVAMTENFHTMSSVEAAILNMEHKILQTSFEQKKGLSGKRIVSGKESNTYEQFKWWLDNEFYHDNTYTQTMADFMIKKLMNVTSATSISFNIMGMVNNAFIASVNNNIESIGGDFFRRESYKKAVKLYFSDYEPGYIKTIGPKSNTYGEKKAGSKYEALVRYFNMVKKSNNETTGKVEWLAKFGGYKGYDMGEYMVQSEIGIAILDSVMIGPEGKQLSLYDAYNFDPNTGEVTLKEGYNLDSVQKHDVTHRIWKTNERIHGNYRWKVMLEKYMVGRIALQFHKWVYPAYKIRFDSEHFDEALGGGMDIEGRYTTLRRFLFEMNGLIKRTEAWNSLTPLQKNNLKKDLVDVLYICILIAAGAIVKKLSEDIPDDDPYLKKFTNWMQYQADRGVQELSLFVPVWGLIESYKLIKNPFAVTSSLNKFQKLLVDVTAYPLRDEESRVYQRGPFKDQDKVWHDLNSLTPVLREIDQFDLLQTKNNFYIP